MNTERGKESREEENGRKDGSKNLERGKRSREEKKKKRKKNITYLGDVYNEKNRPGCSPVKRVSRLEGMILIFVYSEILSHFAGMDVSRGFVLS